MDGGGILVFEFTVEVCSPIDRTGILNMLVTVDPKIANLFGMVEECTRWTRIFRGAILSRAWRLPH
jgi:hypothetical protein